MALSTTLKLKFDGVEVKKGLASVTNHFKSIGEAAMSLTKIGVGVAAGLAGVTAGLVAVALKINKIGEEGNTVDARLANVTKQMGLFGSEAKNVSDRLSELADTQGRLLGIDDDVISNTEAKLMTFKELAASADKAGGAFDRATMAAIDMAAAGFGEAEQNAVQLGKALNDPIKGINSLTRSGITFTTEEKKKIKTLVESRKMLEAQDMVLKAIEKQVGNTAAATANGSDKMKVAFSQLVENFAKPFSEGFNSIPGALEGIFPRLNAAATKAGLIVGGAISDAVRGDFAKFAAIGDLIGSAILVGIKSALEGSSILILGSISKGVAGMLGKRSEASDARFDQNQSIILKSMLEGNIANSGLREKAAAISDSANPQVQRMREVRQPTIPNPWDRSTYNDNGEGIRLLKNIERHLAPQP